jgi:hypothetical protein
LEFIERRYVTDACGLIERNKKVVGGDEDSRHPNAVEATAAPDDEVPDSSNRITDVSELKGLALAMRAASPC